MCTQEAIISIRQKNIILRLCMLVFDGCDKFTSFDYKITIFICIQYTHRDDHQIKISSNFYIMNAIVEL